jgi:hypothetical protein
MTCLILLSGLLGFWGGLLLLSALDWLRPAAVVIACVVCVALAWEMYRGAS